MKMGFQLGGGVGGHPATGRKERTDILFGLFVYLKYVLCERSYDVSLYSISISLVFFDGFRIVLILNENK